MGETIYPDPGLTLGTADHEVGAVEIKDGAADRRAAVDGGGRLAVRLAPGGSTLTLTTGARSVASAGTAVPLSDEPRPVWAVDILAAPANAGKIYVGGPGVNQDALPMAALSAGDFYSVSGPPGGTLDLAELFLDADVDGEGAVYNAYVVV